MGLHQYAQYLSEHDFFSATSHIDNTTPEMVLEHAYKLLKSGGIDEECIKRIESYYASDSNRGNDEIIYNRSNRPAIYSSEIQGHVYMVDDSNSVGGEPRGTSAPMEIVSEVGSHLKRQLLENKRP